MGTRFFSVLVPCTGSRHLCCDLHKPFRTACLLVDLLDPQRHWAILVSVAVSVVLAPTSMHVGVVPPITAIVAMYHLSSLDSSLRCCKAREWACDISPLVLQVKPVSIAVCTCG